MVVVVVAVLVLAGVYCVKRAHRAIDCAHLFHLIATTILYKDLLLGLPDEVSPLVIIMSALSVLSDGYLLS